MKNFLKRKKNTKRTQKNYLRYIKFITITSDNRFFSCIGMKCHKFNQIKSPINTGFFYRCHKFPGGATIVPHKKIKKIVTKLGIKVSIKKCPYIKL